MASLTDIHVGNLHDALQQAQRCLLLGATSAALLLVLTIEHPDLRDAASKVQVPSIGTVDPGVAIVCFAFGFLAFGVGANAALGRAFAAALAIHEQEPALAEAALLRHCFATADSALVRVGAALFPPLLLLAGQAVARYRGGAAAVSGGDTAALILGLLLFCMPYIVLALRLLARPTAAHLHRQRQQAAARQRR